VTTKAEVAYFDESGEQHSVIIDVAGGPILSLESVMIGDGATVIHPEIIRVFEEE